MKNTTIALAGIVILVILGILFLNPNENKNDNKDNIPTSWQQYNNAELGIGLMKPPEVEVSNETDASVRLRFIGPNSKANTEITDGYTMTISLYEKSAFSNLKALAEDRVESTKQIGQIEKPIEESTYQEKRALTFTGRSVGPETKHTFFERNGFYYQISESISGQNSTQYKNEIDLIKSGIDFSEPTSTAPLFSEIKIALLDTSPSGSPERGCDDVVLLKRPTERTRTPLTSALNFLFNLDSEEVDGYMHFISRTNETLSFDKAEIKNGVAHIYLTGELSGLRGVCDNPRTAIQIEETAKQFSTVNSVQLYLNGEKTKLIPSEKGS